MSGVISACWAILVLLLASQHGSTEDVQRRAGEAPEVTIAQGVVTGLEMTSLRGRQFYAYRGIPYAKAPIGELRFRAPEPVDPGNEVVDGTADGPFCTQKNYFALVPVVEGQEDCLSINVYTPQPGNTNLPVMVWIHGGAFFAASGASRLFGPNYLLDKDIVMVSFNYRLGALGFLSTGDAAAPGNYGFKDQVAALKWVRDNIAAFGGDPGNVTIFGQSAGGASVHYHMISSQSTGLFHRAISESGVALNSWAWPPLNPFPIARGQAAYFNCPTDDSQLLIDCLRQVDADALTDSGDIFHFWSIDPLVTFGPVVEDPLNQDSFLTGQPLDLLHAGRFNQVPWLMGVVAQEGIIRGQPYLSNATLLADLNANWMTLAPQVLELDKSIDNSIVVQEMMKNITTFYFNNELPITAINGLDLIDLSSDRGIIHGVHKSVLIQASQGHDSIYMYNFNYRGRDSYSNYFAYNPINYGISHNDERIYLFKHTGMFPDWPEHHPDLKMVDSMVTLWTNFAIHGTPTPPGGASSDHVSCDINSVDTDDRCDLSQLSWSPVPVVPLPGEPGLRTSYLNIYLNNATQNPTLDFAMERDFYKERMEFWDSAPLNENIM